MKRSSRAWFLGGLLLALGADFEATASESGNVHLEIALSSRDYPDFDANPAIPGAVGRIALFTAETIIRTEGLPASPRIQGWSWSLFHEGVVLLSISVEGTVTADTWHGGAVDGESGYVVYEAIDPPKNDMREGVVQAVVLSLLKDIGLPPGTHITGRHVVEDDGEALSDCDDPDCGAAPLCSGGAAGFDFILYAEGARKETDRYVLQVDPSERPSVEVTTWIVPFPEPQPHGPQGWSLSIAHEKKVLEFDPDGGYPTVEGTDADALYSGGLLGAGGGEEDEEDHGFVSAVVLSLMEPLTLDPTRPQSVARARYRIRDEPSATSGPVLVRFRDDLRGSGQPIANLMTIFGRQVRPLHLIPLELRPKDRFSPFVRGDANGDAKVNIADAIWCVNELVRRGPRSRCPRAADTNADGLQDLSDAAYLIQWLFLRGPTPPPPHPACGFDWRPSDLECRAGSVAYCP